MKKISKLVLPLASAALLLFSQSVSAQELPSKDWANYGRYAAANSRVNGKPLAVLMGDSITDGWYSNDSTFFLQNNLIGRGISGQVTSQMLCRFRSDVIAHHPKYVVILGGINDIARNNGYISVKDAVDNIISMCELARANKIRPVVCTLLPSDQIRWRSALTGTRDLVREFNQLLKEYAAKNKIPVIDYETLLADPEGNTRDDLSKDSVHPNKDGYALMEAALLKVLK